MTEDGYSPTADDWALARAMAAESGMVVITTDTLPVGGAIPLTADVRAQLADALARKAIALLQEGDLVQARAHCRAALTQSRRNETALACELAILRAAGTRSFTDNYVDVNNGKRDPFIVSVSYLISAEPIASQATGLATPSEGRFVTKDTLAAGYFAWRSIDQHPDVSAPLANLAATLTDMGALIGADEALHRALKINPFDAHALYNLGCARLRERRLAEAADLLQRAKAQGHAKAGNLLEQNREQLQEVEMKLAHAVDLSMAAEFLYCLGRHDDIIDIYLNEAPGIRNSRTIWLTGQALLNRLRFKEAAEVFESLSSAAPLSSRLWAAAAYKRDGQFTRAATLGKSVAEADPLLLDAHYLLADIHRQLGDKQEEQRAIVVLFMLETVGGGSFQT